MVQRESIRKMNKAGPIKMWNRKTTFSVYGGLDFSIDMCLGKMNMEFLTYL